MKINKVVLYVTSNNLHLQQIYTGFSILAKTGLINLKQILIRENKDLPYHLKNELIRVEVDDKYVVYYDLWDGWQIEERILDECDFYFKRSYAPEKLKGLGMSTDKIFPLGFNYLVFSQGFDKFLFKRLLRYDEIKRKLYYLFNNLNLFSNKISGQKIKNIQYLPELDKPSKIIYIVRAWDQADVSEKYDRSHLDEINENRANCILNLKKKFKHWFYGGFIPSQYAKKKYPGLIIENYDASRPVYLKILKSYSIGIATKGLRGSTGCKMGEYIAHGMAIVSERNEIKVPGNFYEGKNYLGFSNLEECIEKTTILVENSQVRKNMMINNSIYYFTNLKPDILVLNTLFCLYSSLI